MQKQETNVDRGPKKKAKWKKKTNFVGEIRKCFFLIAINGTLSRRSTKLQALGWFKTFASASAIKAEQTDVEMCLEFVNIAFGASALFLKKPKFPPDFNQKVPPTWKPMHTSWVLLTSIYSRLNEFKVSLWADSNVSQDELVGDADYQQFMPVAISEARLRWLKTTHFSSTYQQKFRFRARQ